MRTFEACECVVCVCVCVCVGGGGGGGWGGGGHQELSITPSYVFIQTLLFNRLQVK